MMQNVSPGRGEAEEAGGARRRGSRLWGDVGGEAGTGRENCARGRRGIVNGSREGQNEAPERKDGAASPEPRRYPREGPRLTNHLGPPPPLQLFEGLLSPAHLFQGRSWCRRPIPTALHVPFALEMGSPVRDGHQVPFAAPTRPGSPARPPSKAQTPCACSARGHQALKSRRESRGRSLPG